MSTEAKRAYDRAYYEAHRESIIAQVRSRYIPHPLVEPNRPWLGRSRDERTRQKISKSLQAPVGSRYADASGYIHVKIAPPNQWELEHRFVCAAANGPIRDGCLIHHVDGDVQNNAIENLDCMTYAEHARLHDVAQNWRPR